MTGDAARRGSESIADRFLRLGCLAYDEVGPDEWAEARSLLRDHPEIIDGNVSVASAAGDLAALGRALDVDPGAHRRAGGPHRWEPMLYLAYARHDPTIAEDAVLGTARALLAAGADPNARFTIGDLPTPFTVLTGVFGEGERGPRLQPRHPHSRALARLLLEHGADPNDDQVLYNRMFGADDDHLELLLEFGLGAGLARTQLGWAIAHGMVERVRLLADGGVDVAAPLDEPLWGITEWAALDGDDPTPTVVAALTGHAEVLPLLIERGAPPLNLSSAGAFVAAVLGGDRGAVDRLRSDHRDLADQSRATRPGLVPWAAALGRSDAIELLVELGFDIDARGRTDVPGNQPWQTALHQAVDAGDVGLGRILLGLGADPDVTDDRFDSTPLEWALHLGRPEMVALLEPVTTAHRS